LHNALPIYVVTSQLCLLVIADQQDDMFETLLIPRRSTGEYFLPIIFVVLVLTLFPIPAVQIGAVALMYSVLVVAVIDGFFLSRKIRKAIAVKFPGTSTKGLGMYAWLRSTQMRRLRAPHPQVKVGDSID
jgi:hypothetical protein